MGVGVTLGLRYAPAAFKAYGFNPNLWVGVHRGTTLVRNNPLLGLSAIAIPDMVLVWASQERSGISIAVFDITLNPHSRPYPTKTVWPVRRVLLITRSLSGVWKFAFHYYRASGFCTSSGSIPRNHTERGHGPIILLDMTWVAQ